MRCRCWPRWAWPLRLWQHSAVRRGVLLAVLAALWELAARQTANDLLLPSFTATMRALAEGLDSGELPAKAAISLSLLLRGYVLGIALAFALTTLAVSTRIGRDLLGGLRFVALILVPSALPSILSGLKIAWAFAWRTLIAAELVFGASSGQGGLGWYVFQNRNELYTDRVFAGLICVIVIGLAVEGLVFSTLERLTVRRWGTQR